MRKTPDVRATGTGTRHAMADQGLERHRSSNDPGICPSITAGSPSRPRSHGHSETCAIRTGFTDFGQTGLIADAVTGRMPDVLPDLRRLPRRRSSSARIGHETIASSSASCRGKRTWQCRHRAASCIVPGISMFPLCLADGNDPHRETRRPVWPREIRLTADGPRARKRGPASGSGVSYAQSGAAPGPDSARRRHGRFGGNVQPVQEVPGKQVGWLAV